MSDYTPTTEEVRHGWKWRDDEEFAHWLNEVKAEAWHEGERRGRDNERALMMCQAQLRPSSSVVLITNPYRQGEEHTHTKRSSFGDPYCKICGIDLEGETE